MNNNIKGESLAKRLSCLFVEARQKSMFFSYWTGLNIYYWKKIVKYFDFVKYNFLSHVVEVYFLFIKSFQYLKELGIELQG